MPETLEAEVIEVDGKPPPRPERNPEPEVRGWGGMPRTIRLDRRWWPLWILLGGLLLIAGVVFGTLYLIFAAIRGVLRFLFGEPSSR